METVEQAAARTAAATAPPPQAPSLQGEGVVVPMPRAFREALR
jgi:hypothetical protein